LRQVELIPSGVFHHPRVGQRSFGGRALAFQRAGVHGVELEVLRPEKLAEKPGLFAAQIGQRIVMLARAGLAVAHQIEHAQPMVSIMTAARSTSVLTRSSKCRKRSSVVWPRQNRK